jgi:hypothetical protein
MSHNITTLKASVLNRDERAELDRCESVISTSIDHFYRAGEALKIIRDNRLFKESYSSFDDYCRARWNGAISGRQAFNLIIHYEAITQANLPSDMSVRSTNALKRANHPPKDVVAKAVEITGKAVSDLTEPDILDADLSLDEERGRDVVLVEQSPTARLRLKFVELTEDLKAQGRRLQDCRSELCRIAEQNPGWMDVAPFHNALTVAMKMVKQSIPHAFCGRCDGVGCPHCCHSGYVPSHVYFGLPEDERGMEL